MATSLPYERSSTDDRALGDMQKILRAFGCQKFGSMIDDAEGTLLVQFEYRGRNVSVTASSKGYAAAWLRIHKATGKANEAKALKIGRTAVYSILRDWIKGQIMAIETGVLSFEGAFLGQILLGNGQTVLDFVTRDAKVLSIEGPR